MTQLGDTISSLVGSDTVEIEPGHARVRAAATPASCFRWKGLTDPILAAILLIPGLPLIAGLVLLIRLNSKGPGIFRQKRVGKNGRVFTMYKLRTMAQNAEAKTGPVWTQVGDPRVTRLGWVLRKLHLDELPQLFNVLRGEMALIGPRPERPEFVQVLAKLVPGYAERLTVRPGVTGLAQINLPPDSDLISVWRKLQLDLEYIETASFLLDLRMFLCTTVRLLAMPGDFVMWLFFVKRAAPEIPTDVEWILTANTKNLRPATSGQAEPSASGHSKSCGNGSEDSGRLGISHPGKLASTKPR